MAGLKKSRGGKKRKPSQDSEIRGRKKGRVEPDSPEESENEPTPTLSRKPSATISRKASATLSRKASVRTEEEEDAANEDAEIIEVKSTDDEGEDGGNELTAEVRLGE